MNKKELKLLERGFDYNCYWSKTALKSAIASCKRNNQKYITITKTDHSNKLNFYYIYFRENQTLTELEIENKKLKEKLEQIKQDFYRLQDTLEV